MVYVRRNAFCQMLALESSPNLVALSTNSPVEVSKKREKSLRERLLQLVDFLVKHYLSLWSVFTMAVSDQGLTAASPSSPSSPFCAPFLPTNDADTLPPDVVVPYIQPTLPGSLKKRGSNHGSTLRAGRDWGACQGLRIQGAQLILSLHAARQGFLGYKSPSITPRQLGQPHIATISNAVSLPVTHCIASPHPPSQDLTLLCSPSFFAPRIFGRLEPSHSQSVFFCP